MRRKTVKVGQEGKLSRWDKKEDCQGGTRRKIVKVVSCSQTAIWFQLCLYEDGLGTIACFLVQQSSGSVCVCSGVYVEGGQYWSTGVCHYNSRHGQVDVPQGI